MTALLDTANTSNFIEKEGEGWQKIETAPRDGTVIDVWLEIYPSPMSMGLVDEFGVPDVWYQGGKWVHTYRGKPTELDSSYIMRWRPKKSVPVE